MSVRRQLVNFGSTCTDYRIGSGALDELPRYLKNVVGSPKRSLMVVDALPSDEMRQIVRRSLVDNGFSVDEVSLEGEDEVRSLACAERVFADMDRTGITADDLVVAVGSADVCSTVAFCARTWCGGMSCAAVPMTLDAMCTVPTSIRPLACAGSEGMVSIRPDWDLVVCDLDLVMGLGPDQLGLGYAEMLSSALAQSRRIWDQFPAKIEGMVAGNEVSFIDALCGAQTARSGQVRSANPSAKNAMQYGLTTAHALRACLGPDVPAYQLLAEGMRFEARVAHDACGLEVEVVFDQDDRLEDLGIEELGFDLDAERFVEALRRVRFKRANRFMFALPKNPGAIRLCAVDDDVLMRHAKAYLASRAELLEEGE